MKTKIVKCRKSHMCDTCTRTINKGEIAEYQEIRIAKFDDIDNQIGIEFLKFYMCDDCQKQLEQDIESAVCSLMIENSLEEVRNYYPN